MNAIEPREAIWSHFLERWPLERLSAMSLPSYNQAGDDETFCRWLEGHTESLGSILGGSSLKFGIYSRRNSGKDPSRQAGVLANADYAWYARYGNSAAQAFEAVRALIAQVASAARAGDWDAIETIDLWPTLKWKIAFLYQDRAHPGLLPIYKRDMLQAAAGGDAVSHAELNRRLMLRRGDRPLFEYYDQLLAALPVADQPIFSESPVMPALNQILYGPPGTGKTFATIDHALAILDPHFLANNQGQRSLLKARFDQLAQEGRVRFVTFHQSFSYEDFVEGLRAEVDEHTGQLRYAVVDGVFKSICEAAASKVAQQADAPIEIGQRRVWKMSLGNTLGEDASIYQECLAGGYVLLGYGGAIDFSGCANRQQVQERFASAGILPANPATDYGITSVTAFVTRMAVGDLVVVSDGNFKLRAIGEITGDYQFKPHQAFDADYSQMRTVKWLLQYQPSLPHGELLNAQFSQMTLYELREPTLNRGKLKALFGAPARSNGFVPGQVFGRDYQVVRATTELLELRKPNGNLVCFSMLMLRELKEAVHAGKISLQDIREKSAIEKLPGTSLEPYLVNGYNNILAPLIQHLLDDGAPTAGADVAVDARVLIIDEINRGSVSRIFGELITLIEPSKRQGAEEALAVTLPYSKEAFSVPDNVYIIGTMNTADRSLAGLDIALRRRFSFKEMPPRPELLDEVAVGDVNIGELLRAMNERIEVLLDRDHCLGHAYFMPLAQNGSLEILASIFRNQILPLLQEYFFEDWERIGWVLNDPQAVARGVEPFVKRPESEQSLMALFGSEVAAKLNDVRWLLNEGAFNSLDSYRNILG